MMPLTMAQRAATYARTFPEWPSSWPQVVREDGRDVLQGVWMFGQDYRNASAYYGAYPGNFLDRLSALFPEYTLKPDMLPMGRGRTLHAFSGSLAPGPYDRCDVVQAAEWQCDVRKLPEVLLEAAAGSAPDYWDSLYELVVADPPYSDEDAAKYKAPPLNRIAQTAALAEVTGIGGHLCWLDTTWPMHTKEQWVTVGRIFVLRSTNHRVRLLSIFERVNGAP